MSATFDPIAPRPAPVRTEGFVPWVRRNLFGDIKSTITTVVIALLAVLYLPPLINWAFVQAVYQPDAEACQAARGSGACWGAIVEKYRLVIFGRYPFDDQWRPLLATALMLGLLVASCTRPLWNKWLVVLWLVVLAAFFVLMGGGWFGLEEVSTDQWGGLPLTIMLASLSIVFAFPLAVLVALGRRSHLPAIRTFCTLYVELIRGVPLISVLFMASFMFPLFMPQGMTIDVEAAQSLGLSYWQTQRKIVLPQALALVVPGIMNNFISIFKDTSLVTIVSLYELTGSTGLAFNSDADWRPFKIEAYLFITAIYFVFCFAMSRYSLWIEKQLNRSRTR